MFRRQKGVMQEGRNVYDVMSPDDPPALHTRTRTRKGETTISPAFQHSDPGEIREGDSHQGRKQRPLFGPGPRP